MQKIVKSAIICRKRLGFENSNARHRHFELQEVPLKSTTSSSVLQFMVLLFRPQLFCRSLAVDFLQCNNLKHNVHIGNLHYLKEVLNEFPGF